MRFRGPKGPSINDDAAVVPIVTVSEVAEAAVKVQLDSEGRPEHVNEGAVLKPPSMPTVIVPTPFCPGEGTVMLSVLGPMVKS